MNREIRWFWLLTVAACLIGIADHYYMMSLVSAKHSINEGLCDDLTTVISEVESLRIECDTLKQRRPIIGTVWYWYRPASSN